MLKKSLLGVFKVYDRKDRVVKEVKVNTQNPTNVAYGMIQAMKDGNECTFFGEGGTSKWLSDEGVHDHRCVFGRVARFVEIGELRAMGELTEALTLIQVRQNREEK